MKNISVWRVELFGGLRLFCEGKPVPVTYPSKTRLLLSYLAHHLGKPQPREELMDMLWPDGTQEQGRNRLNNALSVLRAQLEPAGRRKGSVLISRHADACLSAQAVGCDAVDVETTRRKAHSAKPVSQAELLVIWEDITEHYQGPFLPGFYDDWVLSARAYYEAAYQEAALRLIQALRQAGERDQALMKALRVVRLLPNWEQGYFEVMQIYADTGFPSLALSHYNELARVLAEEGVAPSPELQAQADRWRRGQAFATAFEPPLWPPPADMKKRRLAIEGLPRFFGREDELAQVLTLLGMNRIAPGNLSIAGPAPPRLISLVGPAGAGKTRLAQQATAPSHLLADASVFFVPLAPLDDGALIPFAIASAIGLTLAPMGDPLLQIASRLTGKTVLVLDNMEHLLAKGRATVMALLEQLPQLICLVTSRQRLDLPGERVVIVNPFLVPAEDFEDVDGLLKFPAVQLFVDRAQAVSPAFILTPASVLAIASLCRRLEGLPLSLEIAAAWSRVLTPSDMLFRLGRRLDLLTNRSSAADQRHASLRTALNWSFLLLPPSVQRFLAAASVFHGGWSLEAAEEVCEEPLALEYSAQLLEASLIVAEQGNAEMRFSLLETVRGFALEKLAPEELSRICGRHAEYFLKFGKDAKPKLEGTAQAAQIERLRMDYDNLRAALNWYAGDSTQAGAEGGLRLTAALWRFWDLGGFFTEARREYDRALAHARAGRPTESRANTLLAAGGLDYRQQEYGLAQARWEEGLAIWQELLGQRYDREDTRGMAKCLGNLAMVAETLGDTAFARSRHQQSLAVFRELDDRRGIAVALLSLGNLDYMDGDVAAARELWEESRRYWHALGDRGGEATVLGNLGQASRERGEFAEARRFQTECLRLRQRLDHGSGTATVLEEVANLAVEEGHYDQAARIYGRVERLLEDLGITSPPEDKYLDKLRQTLGPERFRAIWAEGRLANLDEMIQQCIDSTP